MWFMRTQIVLLVSALLILLWGSVKNNNLILIIGKILHAHYNCPTPHRLCWILNFVCLNQPVFVTWVTSLLYTVFLSSCLRKNYHYIFNSVHQLILMTLKSKCWCITLWQYASELNVPLGKKCESVLKSTPHKCR